MIHTFEILGSSHMQNECLLDAEEMKPLDPLSSEVGKGRKKKFC